MKSRQAGSRLLGTYAQQMRRTESSQDFLFHSNQKHRQQEETVTSGCCTGAKVQLKSSIDIYINIYIYICVNIQCRRQTHAHADELKFRLGGKKSTQICTELAAAAGLQLSSGRKNFSDFCTLNFLMSYQGPVHQLNGRWTRPSCAVGTKRYDTSSQT